MLSLLLAHIVITACCFWSGFIFYNLVLKEKVARPIIFYLVSGLISLTILAQIIVLLFPIGLLVQLIIGGILLAFGVAKWKDCRSLFNRLLIECSTWRTLPSIVFLLSWTTILLISAGPTLMDDTESYHIQSIKWIKEYGSVPGLVNLHERFGFNSSWFSTVALFSFSPGSTGGFTALNGILSMWLCYWFFSKYNGCKGSNNPQAALAIITTFIVCLLVWPLIRGNAATTNYDFITTVVVLVLFPEIFFNEKSPPSGEWMIWPAYLFTVRIINLPFLLLGLFAIILYVRQKKIRATFTLIACCTLLIIPFLIRNILIAGYPFYPATFFDLTNVDWKPDPVLTERLLEYIKYYNRVSTTYLDIGETKALGANWFLSWFKYLFPFDKILVIAGSAGIIFTGIKMLNQKINYAKAMVTGIMIIWLICWFLVAPDPRFVYGVLLLGIFLLAFDLMSLIKNIGSIQLLPKILVILLAVGLSYYLVSKTWKQKEYSNWLVPMKLLQPPVKEIEIDNVIFRLPEPVNNNWNARCYGSDLPCLYILDHRLKPRGKNIRSGFHLEK